MCDGQAREAGLLVDTRHREKRDAQRGILGRITFVHRQSWSSSIVRAECVSASLSPTSCATCFSATGIKEDADLGIDELRHLEWQANYFASCLPVPRDALIACTLVKARSLDLWDRGQGLIFVDNQRCNIENYDVVTTALMKAFDVSRATLKIRLQALGLVNDSRSRQADAANFAAIGSNFRIKTARRTPPGLRAY